MGDAPLDAQAEFFNRARRSGAPVTIYLANGKKLSGRIKSFDRFTVVLLVQRSEQMIFKHAISTVSLGSGTAPPALAPRSAAGDDATSAEPS